MRFREKDSKAIMLRLSEKINTRTKLNLEAGSMSKKAREAMAMIL